MASSKNEDRDSYSESEDDYSSEDTQDESADETAEDEDDEDYESDADGDYSEDDQSYCSYTAYDDGGEDYSFPFDSNGGSGNASVGEVVMGIVVKAVIKGAKSAVKKHATKFTKKQVNKAFKKMSQKKKGSTKKEKSSRRKKKPTALPQEDLASTSQIIKAQKESDMPSALNMVEDNESVPFSETSSSPSSEQTLSSYKIANAMKKVRNVFATKFERSKNNSSLTSEGAVIASTSKLAEALPLFNRIPPPRPPPPSLHS